MTRETRTIIEAETIVTVTRADFSIEAIVLDYSQVLLLFFVINLARRLVQISGG